MLIAIPTMGTIATPLAEWLCYQKMFGHEVFFTDTITPHARARNRIVDYFLKDTSHDVLLMVDADTIPPLTAVEHLHDLIQSGAAVATGITPTIRETYVVANVYRDHKDAEWPLSMNQLPKQPFEVVGCGASCLMVSRATFNVLTLPYFKSIEFDNGKYCSEDLYFCDKVREKGMSIVAHHEVICKHAKTILL